MKTIFSITPCALAAMFAAALGGHAGIVQAVEIERVYHQNPAAYCQGALKVFADALRARPLGVGNEGASPAFVTCSFSSQENETITRLSTYWTNNTGADITINCTGVFGIQRFDNSTIYLPKSVTVAPGASENLAWMDVDNGGNPLFEPANISCALPAGAVMLDTYFYYNVEIGA